MNFQTPTNRSSLYAIVLAGGQGERLQPLSQRLVGSAVPKQYLPLVTRKSLLQETQSRLQSQFQLAETLVVVAKTWAPLAGRQLREFARVRIVAQPKDRGTAAGLLLALSHVLATDPEADVVVTPADQHFDDPTALRSAVRRARVATRHHPDKVCMLAVNPENAATDLSWCVKGKPVKGTANDEVSIVDRVVSRPAEPVARRLLHQGGLWNTMIMTGRARTLWNTVFDRNPTLAALMEPLTHHIGHRQGHEFVEQLYPQLPTVDLCDQVLADATNLMMTSVHQAGWLGCGTPQRLFDWLRRSPNSQSPFRQSSQEGQAA